MVARAYQLGAQPSEMKELLQYNGGWKISNQAIQSLQIAHDELMKIEWNHKTILLHDYKFAPNRFALRCWDHHKHNGFDKEMEVMNTYGGEKVFQDRNQVHKF